MNPQELEQFVKDNPRLVSMRPVVKYPNLFLLKYSKRVFYDDLFNSYLEECRGTIVDSHFNVISRPFTKIYNYGIEAAAPKLDPLTAVTAYRKVNGFMVAATWYDDDILLSTTGSTDSDYVNMAREIMLTHADWAHWQAVLKQRDHYTLMFECCHPQDPHIIPERRGMYFLGWRANTWDSLVEGWDHAELWEDFAVQQLKCFPVAFLRTHLGELLGLTQACGHEGFVFYNKHNVSSKIKSPLYLTLKWMARNPRTDKLMTQEFRQQIDEEYYGLLDYIRANIDFYTLLDEQQRLEFARAYFLNHTTSVYNQQR